MNKEDEEIEIPLEPKVRVIDEDVTKILEMNERLINYFNGVTTKKKKKEEEEIDDTLPTEDDMGCWD